MHFNHALLLSRRIMWHWYLAKLKLTHKTILSILLEHIFIEHKINLSMNQSQSAHPCGAHVGWVWAGKWAPCGHPSWDPANFVRSFHGGPSWASPHGLQVGHIWALVKTHMVNPGLLNLGPTGVHPYELMMGLSQVIPCIFKGYNHYLYGLLKLFVWVTLFYSKPLFSLLTVYRWTTIMRKRPEIQINGIYVYIYLFSNF